MQIKITEDVTASANESGNQTRLYTKDEIVDCKHKWQEDLAKILVDGGLAMEVKVDAPKEKKSADKPKKVAKKVAKKKTTKK